MGPLSFFLFFFLRENRFRLAEPPELKGRRGVIHYTSLTRTFSCVCVCETRLFFPVQVPQGIEASLCVFLVRVFSLLTNGFHHLFYFLKNQTQDDDDEGEEETTGQTKGVSTLPLPSSRVQRKKE